MKIEKLYRCCNTCSHQTKNIYGCKIPKECFNGFSAYDPSEAMKTQEAAENNVMQLEAE